MIFSASDFTMDQKSPDANKGQSFAPLPLEPNGRNKSMGAHDRIPPDPANSRHSCTVTFAGGPFRNSPLRSDQEGSASERSSSSRKRNPRSATARRSTSSTEEPAAETSATATDQRAQHAPPASAAPRGDEDDCTKPATNQAPP
jgi:hypothetical protein